jgi:hypothetical protein
VPLLIVNMLVVRSEIDCPKVIVMLNAPLIELLELLDKVVVMDSVKVGDVKLVAEVLAVVVGDAVVVAAAVTVTVVVVVVVVAAADVVALLLVVGAAVVVVTFVGTVVVVTLEAAGTVDGGKVADWIVVFKFAKDNPLFTASVAAEVFCCSN